MASTIPQISWQAICCLRHHGGDDEQSPFRNESDAARAKVRQTLGLYKLKRQLYLEIVDRIAPSFGLEQSNLGQHVGRTAATSSGAETCFAFSGSISIFEYSEGLKARQKNTSY